MSQQSNRKRKRSSSEWQARPATPLSAISINGSLDKPDHTGDFFSSVLFLLKESRHANQFFEQEVRDRTFDMAAIIGDDRTFVQVAQMVADQAISSTKTSRSSRLLSLEQSLVEADVHQAILRVLTLWASKAGKVSKRCTLLDFVGCDDQEPPSIVRDSKFHKPPHPNRATTIAQLISRLPSPYTCVQRSNTVIDVAASALRFWEELSFAPSYGSKDVTAFCIYPTEREHGDEILIFLSMIKGAYLSCKLGMHNLGSDAAKKNNGLVPMPIGLNKLQDSLPEIYQACENFGSWLGMLRLQRHNTVIYMVNSSNDESSLPLLCAAFLRLFNAYMRSVKEHSIDSPNDLVLQIVPSHLIYSDVEIVLPSPAEYRALAFEIYNRCGPSEDGEDKGRLQYICAPSMRLAKAIPKNIDFRLTPDNPAFSLQSDNCVHVAYSWTPGNDWLTASWTDNLGILSWNACYCFGNGKNHLWRSLAEIANEIWETTLEMLQPRNGRWRLLLCKDGAVYKHELEGEYSALLRLPCGSNLMSSLASGDYG